jgi:CheY-like chemotaxis protein
MPTLLIATDNTEDAKEVKDVLTENYQNIFISLTPDTSVQDFESHRPDILVLAFKTLEKAERYYLGLYRLSSLIHIHPHRTIILCNKTEVRRVYELCKKGYFDDYIQYWPIMYDAPRLAMAVHHAMSDLANINSSYSVVEIASEARRLSELESLLGWNVTQGNQLIEAASHSITDAEQEMQASLSRFSQRLTQGDFANLVEIKNAQGLQQEISNLQQEYIHGRFEAVNEFIKPLKRLAEEFQQKFAPYLESARALKIMAEKIPVTILVVDDDEIICNLLKTILAQEGYEPMLANSGVEALSLLRKQRPSLILMDMMMPEMDGLETTCRIKAAVQFSGIPIIMVTGNSERSFITRCLKAGAVDFVVKPFNREVLLEKISKLLH